LLQVLVRIQPVSKSGNAEEEEEAELKISKMKTLGFSFSIHLKTMIAAPIRMSRNGGKVAKNPSKARALKLKISKFIIRKMLAHLEGINGGGQHLAVAVGGEEGAQRAADDHNGD
jgi:hypothetical protein